MSFFEDITIAPESDLPIPARLYKPPGEGPFPALVILHGSGGLWRNKKRNTRLTKNLEEWVNILVKMGIVVLLPDSFSPRGLIDFKNRRPAYDPNLDDSLCSPTHKRPEDAFKALSYLRKQPYIMSDYIGALGFSHGAQTLLVTVLHPTIEKKPWTQLYLDENNKETTKPTADPPRPPPGGTFKFGIAYYPGCSMYNFFGRPSDTGAGHYMPAVPLLIMHGTKDELYVTGYPEKLARKAHSHAAYLGVPPLLKAVTFEGAGHSFDMATDMSSLSNQQAKRQARQIALHWIRRFLIHRNVPDVSVIDVNEL